jgi:hypothetical protein
MYFFLQENTLIFDMEKIAEVSRERRNTFEGFEVFVSFRHVFINDFVLVHNHQEASTNRWRDQLRRGGASSRL